MVTINLCLTLCGYAQLTKDYTPMESKGTIPEEFITPIENRYSKSVTQIAKSDNRRTRIDKRDFLLESHNELDLYLKSGLVVFNDEVNQYINKVAATLLKSEGDKAENVKFYPIKFDYSNAFAFNEGVVFVNVGLIARCENEAELAFILGHEYGHYIKHHSINYNVKVKQMARGQGAYRKKDVNDKMRLMSRYSKNNEMDADMYGYKLLTKTDYNAKAAITSLQGLEDANTIPEWTSFDKRVIEKGYVRIPKAYLLENKVDTLPTKGKKRDVEEEDEEESEEDSSFTHPSIDERVNKLYNTLVANDTTAKKLFVNSRSEFEYVRELCRFEMCRIYLMHNDIDEAFCLISSLLEKYPDNAYLNKMMSVTLYRLSYAAMNGKLGAVVTVHNKSDEALKERNYVLHKLKKEELVLLALRYSWDVRMKQPKQADVVAINEQLLSMYTSKFKQNLNLFADEASFNESIIDSFYLPEKNNDADAHLAKKKKKPAKKLRGGYDFQRSLSYYALSDLKNDNDFKKAFGNAAKEAKKGDTNTESDEVEEASEDKTDEKAKKDKVKKRERNIVADAEKTSIQSMILLEPEFELTDQRKKVEKNYVANEIAEAKLRKAILECSKKAEVDVKLMNANGIGADETQKMNDYTTLKEFMYEVFNQSDNKHHALPTDFARLKEISERYDSRYLSIMINRNLIKKRKTKEFFIAAGVMIVIPYVGIPYFISKFFHEKEFIYIVGVIDMQTGVLVYGNVLDFHRNETSDLFKSQYYATLIELKGKK